MTTEKPAIHPALKRLHEACPCRIQSLDCDYLCGDICDCRDPYNERRKCQSPIHSAADEIGSELARITEERDNMLIARVHLESRRRISDHLHRLRTPRTGGE